jgi:integrase
LSKSFLAKDDAVRWSREQERLADLGLTSVEIIAQLPVPLSSLMDRYEREVTPSKRSSSDIFVLRQIRRHIGELSVEALTPSVVGRYRDDRLRTVSGSTVRKELTLLSHVLKVARNEWGTPNVDPVASVRKPASARSRTRRPSLEELASLNQALQQCRNPFVKDVFLFALATGMRRGEVLSINSGDKVYH